jgi:hypothetical protein
MGSRTAHRHHFRVVCPLAASAMVWLTLVATSPAAWSFGRTSPVFGDHIHKTITQNAFPFLDGVIVGNAVEGNLNQDVFDSEVDRCERHGCNCPFAESAQFYNDTYKRIIEELIDPDTGWRLPIVNPYRYPVAPNKAAYMFGRILHGVQDFYSHANWVPQPPEGLNLQDRLLDTGVGEWAVLDGYTVLFDDVMVLEGDPPSGVSVRLPVDQMGKVNSAVPAIEDKRHLVAPPTTHRTEAASATGDVAERAAAAATERGLGPAIDFAPKHYRGLMTSASVSDDSQQRCPPQDSDCLESSATNVCLRHGEGRASGSSDRSYEGSGHMNMDRKGDGDWATARHLARRQSIHEWCRLLHLSRDQDSTNVATSRLLAHWVKQGAIAHPDGTACARQSGQYTVEVTATPRNAAPEKTTAVLYRKNMLDSDRSTARRATPVTLSVCANEGEELVVALVNKWKDVASNTIRVVKGGAALIRDHRGAFPVSYVVRVIPNQCRR